MAIIQVAMIPERDRTTSTLSNGKTTISHTDVYQVITDSQNYRGFQILGASAKNGHGTVVTIPSPGSLASNVPPLVIQSSTPQRTADPLVWEVEVNSTSIDLDQSGKWDIEISSDAVTGTENVSHYSDGTLIVNSVGDVYPDGLPQETFDRKYTISFKTDAVEASSLDGIIGKISNDEVTMTVNGISLTFPPKTLKCSNAPWKTTYSSADGSQHQFSVSVELLYRSVTINGEEVGWSQPIVDKGYRQTDDDGNVIVNAQGQPCDDDGNAITSPIFLDGDGSQLDASGGDTNAVFFPDTPKTTYKSVAFNGVLSEIT